MTDDFSEFVRRWIQPCGGQWLRMFTTDWPQPSTARLFLVGLNPHSVFAEAGYTESQIFDMHMNPKVFEELYEQLTPTRRRMQWFLKMLKDEGINDIVMTNSNFYSTADADRLKRLMRQRHEGALRGAEGFPALVKWVRPRVVISHGADARTNIEEGLNIKLPGLPTKPGTHLATTVQRPFGQSTDFSVLRSFSDRGWAQWSSWASIHLPLVVAHVKDSLASDGKR